MELVLLLGPCRLQLPLRLKAVWGRGLDLELPAPFVPYPGWAQGLLLFAGGKEEGGREVTKRWFWCLGLVVFLREGSTSPALAGNDDRTCQNTFILNVLNRAEWRCEPSAFPPAVCAASWQRAPAAHAGKGWGTVQVQKASLEKVSVGSAELNAALVSGAGVALARGRGVSMGRGCPTWGRSPGLGESCLLMEGGALRRCVQG